MLLFLQHGKPTSGGGSLACFWAIVVLSTAMQAIVNSMQFNAQLTFFAKRVDPAIGGSYMTLLNTAANLGGVWPASFCMWLVGALSKEASCTTTDAGVETCVAGRDPFFGLQAVLSVLGCVWIFLLGGRVKKLAELPADAWRTHCLDDGDVENGNSREAVLSTRDVELRGFRRGVAKARRFEKSMS